MTDSAGTDQAQIVIPSKRVGGSSVMYGTFKAKHFLGFHFVHDQGPIEGAVIES